MARSRPAAGFRPRLEALEDRCLMSAGALDTTFNPTGSLPGTVNTYAPTAVALQPDGKIVASILSAQAHFQVARYNVNGSLDTSFNGTGTVVTQIGSRDYANDVAIQADGKIVVGGWSNLPYNPLNRNAVLTQFSLARYTATGTLDQSFGQHGIATSVSNTFGGARGHVAIQADGKIVVAGSGTTNQGPTTSGIGLVRFNADGSLDRSFGSNFSGGWVFTPYTVLFGGEQLTAQDVAIDSAGRLVVVGSAFVYGTGRCPFVARYGADGSLDKTLGGTGVIPLTQFVSVPNSTGEALQADGKIILTSGNEVIRLNPNGTLDTTSFGPLNPDGTHAGFVRNAGGGSQYDVQLESDGKIVVSEYNGGYGAVRLLSDGSLDPSFGSGGISQLETSVSASGALAIQPADGNIVIGGGGGLARLVGDTPTPAVASTLGIAYYYQSYQGITAGSPGTFTVWADNTVVALATGYTGTVHFTSSDPQAVLPADYTFTAADHGAHTFSATFWTPGSQSLSVNDTVTGSLAGSQTGIVVKASPYSATHFSISAPASVTSGMASSFTVTALDKFNNVASYYYTGTVHVTSSDPSATLPPDYTFLGTDRSVHTFTGLVLRTKGRQTLTITDLASGTIFGTITLDVV